MPSEQYLRALEEAKEHHRTAKTYSGKFLRPHKPFLSELIREHECKSALDYGAGKGVQYEWVDPEDGLTLEQAWGIDVQKYDPAWPPFEAEPEGKFDLVMCTHTLGSIPIVDQDWVLDRLFDLTAKVLYIAEKLGPIKKGVHGPRHGFVNNWHRDQWASCIMARAFHRFGPGVKSPYERPPAIWLSTNEKAEGERITTRTRLL